MKNKKKLTLLFFLVLFGITSCWNNNIDNNNTHIISNKVVSKIAVWWKSDSKGSEWVNKYWIELDVEKWKKGTANTSNWGF